MLKIEDQPEFFACALSNEPLICKNHGEWNRQHWISRVITWMFGLEDDTAIRVFTQCLKKLEEKPVAYKGSAEELSDQEAYYNQWIRASKTISTSTRLRASKKMASQLQELDLEIIRLSYRIGGSNHGIDPLSPMEVEMDQFVKWATIVSDWKKEQHLYEEHQLKISDFDSSKIYEMCLYPEYLKLLEKNKGVRDFFLKCAFRDNIDINILCLFHGQIETLYRHHMLGRIGVFFKKMLTIDTQKGEGSNTKYKVLNLLFEGRKVNILDKTQEVVFSNGMKKTIQKVFIDFKKKNLRLGKFEFFYDGIIPWNGNKWGLNQKKVDPSSHEFWNSFPLVDVVLKSDLEQKYRIKIDDEKKWVGVIAAATQSKKLVIENGHGYMLFYIPIGDGQYKVLPIGMFAEKFPTTKWETLCFMNSTVKGTPVFPDPNYYYSHRRKAYFPLVLSEEEGSDILKEVAKTKMEGGVFMFTYENCAYFAQQTFTKVLKRVEEGGKIPEIFKKKFKKCQPVGVVGVLHKIYLMMPKCLLKPYLDLFHFVFGSHRKYSTVIDGETVIKSAYGTEYGGNKTKIIIPGGLQHRLKLRKDNFQGVIYYGN